jgi:hypothetical protein
VDKNLIARLTSLYNEKVNKGSAVANPTFEQFFEGLGVKKDTFGSKDSAIYKAFLNVTTAEFNASDDSSYGGDTDTIPKYNNNSTKDSAIFDDIRFQGVLKKNIGVLNKQIQAKGAEASKVGNMVSGLKDKHLKNSILIDDLSAQFDILEEGYTGVGGFLRTAFNVFKEGSPAQIIHSELGRLKMEQSRINTDLNGKVVRIEGGGQVNHGGLNKDLLILEKDLKNLQIKQNSYKALRGPELDNKEQ